MRRPPTLARYVITKMLTNSAPKKVAKEKCTFTVQKRLMFCQLNKLNSLSAGIIKLALEITELLISVMRLSLMNYLQKK